MLIIFLLFLCADAAAPQRELAYDVQEENVKYYAHTTIIPSSGTLNDHIIRTTTTPSQIRPIKENIPVIVSLCVIGFGGVATIIMCCYLCREWVRGTFHVPQVPAVKWPKSAPFPSSGSSFSLGTPISGNTTVICIPERAHSADGSSEAAGSSVPPPDTVLQME